MASTLIREEADALCSGNYLANGLDLLYGSGFVARAAVALLNVS